MIGTLAVSQLAPLEYRAALDAAMPFLMPDKSIVARCAIPELQREVSQRLQAKPADTQVEAALWVEPLVQSWESDLVELDRSLLPGSQLIVIASLPLARLIPERRSWSGDPLCTHLGGLGKLIQTLERANFTPQEKFGFHAPLTAGLNSLSRTLDRLGRLDLADRLGFAARLRYTTAGLFLGLSTVALLVARKVTT